MPLYEYQCLNCSAVCEILQKAGDQPPASCGACGGPMKKRITAPAIQFKGNGWYITDYAQKHTPSGDAKTNGDNKPAAVESKAEPAKDAAKPAASDSSPHK